MGDLIKIWTSKWKFWFFEGGSNIDFEKKKLLKYKRLTKHLCRIVIKPPGMRSIGVVVSSVFLGTWNGVATTKNEKKSNCYQLVWINLSLEL